VGTWESKGGLPCDTNVGVVAGGREKGGKEDSRGGAKRSVKSDTSFFLARELSGGLQKKSFVNTAGRDVRAGINSSLSLLHLTERDKIWMGRGNFLNWLRFTERCEPRTVDRFS